MCSTNTAQRALSLLVLVLKSEVHLSTFVPFSYETLFGSYSLSQVNVWYFPCSFPSMAPAVSADLIGEEDKYSGFRAATQASSGGGQGERVALCAHASLTTRLRAVVVACTPV